jgi:hypothetical protein
VENTNAVFAGSAAPYYRCEKQDESSRFIGVLAGSLDDPSWFRPQMDIFTSDAQPWDQMDPAIPKHEKYPPMA